MSAPSLAAARRASTKPRWLRHMIATPSPSPTPSSASESASALLRALELAEGQLAELVDHADPVREAERDRREPAGDARPPLLQRQQDTAERDRRVRPDDAGLGRAPSV